MVLDPILEIARRSSITMISLSVADEMRDAKFSIRSTLPSSISLLSSPVYPWMVTSGDLRSWEAT